MKVIFGLGVDTFLEGAFLEKNQMEPYRLCSDDGDYLNPFEEIDPSDRVLIVFVHPAHLLQISADATYPGKKWLSRYELEASQVVSFYRANNSRSIVIDAVDSISAPARLAATLQSRGFPDITLLPSDCPPKHTKTPQLDRHLALELFYSQVTGPDVPTLIACAQVISGDFSLDATAHSAALTEAINERDSLAASEIESSELAARLRTELDHLNTEMQVTSKALQAAEADLANSGEELAVYRDQIVGLYEELEIVATHRSELDFSGREQASQLATLNDALAQAQAQKTQLEADLNDAAMLAENSVNELETLRETLAKSRADAAVLSEENKTLTHLLSVSDSALRSLEQERETLEEHLRERDGELEEKQSRVRELEEAVQLNSAAAANSESQLNELRSQIPWYEVHFAMLVARASLRIAPRRLFRLATDHGRSEGVQQGMTYKDTRNLILNSGLFDTDWYLREYPDVKDWKSTPLDHYLQHGAALGHNPSEAFETLGYLKMNPDVLESGMNPLVHYVLHGQEEGRLCRLGHGTDAGVFAS